MAHPVDRNAVETIDVVAEQQKVVSVTVGGYAEVYGSPHFPVLEKSVGRAVDVAEQPSVAKYCLAPFLANVHTVDPELPRSTYQLDFHDHSGEDPVWYEFGCRDFVGMRE